MYNACTHNTCMHAQYMTLHTAYTMAVIVFFFFFKLKSGLHQDPKIGYALKKLLNILS